MVSSRNIEDEPLISQRAGHAEHLSDSSGDERRVQFNKKKSSQKAEVVESPDNDSDNDDHRKRKG